MTIQEADTEKLITDLKRIASDSEEILQDSANIASDKAQELRQRLSQAVETAKTTCRRLEEKAVAGAKATDKVIRDHPYQTIGVAFGVGLLIGVLASRRGH